jgi:ABC-type multidrug transport system fused ATPase/permease subunit
MPAKTRETIVKSFKRAYHAFLFEHKRKFWISLLLLFINSIIELLGLAAMLPLFSVMLRDNFIQQSPFLLSVFNLLGFQTEFAFVIFLSAILILIIVLKNVLSVYILKYHANFSFSLYNHFSTSLYKYFYDLGYLSFKKYNSNFVVSYVNNHPSFFAQFFILPILTLVNEFTVLAMIVGAMLFYSPLIFILLLVTVLPLFLVSYFYVRKKIGGLGAQKAKYSALLNKSIHQSIEGYVDVKTLGKENYFFEQYKRLVNDHTNLGIKGNVLASLPTKVIEVGMLLGLVCLLVFGLYFIGDKNQIGTLLGVFAIAAYRILPSVNRVMAAILSVREHQYTIDVITLAKPEYAEKKQDENSLQLKFENEIKVEHLEFGYTANDKTLNNVSFEIMKGETIGIIGRSGSGKTTLINLLLRFLVEDSGKVKVDGVVIDANKVAAWRHMLGYVQQSVYIIDGTIAENVAFGSAHEEFDEEKIKGVIEAASLTELVESLPEGIHTKVGERGAALSGGQRQRIGIARALYSDAQVLLFDEATSALDTETETEITESIRKLAEQNLTMIIVAHRYSTLRYCDKILEMENGTITSTHTFEDLYKKTNSSN